MHPSIRRQTIADALRRSALRLPAKAAIICGLTTWTYGEFDALVSRLAASGAGVVSIKPRHSLEEYFLSLTNQGQHVEPVADRAV